MTSRDVLQRRAGRPDAAPEARSAVAVADEPSRPAPRLGVVIPAHDEEAVVTRCLRALFRGWADGELEVVVVANGCTDATAERARAFGHGVRVVELAEGSKPAALNAGDRLCTAYPRVYLDADVELGPGALRELERVLTTGQARAAAPGVRFDTTGRPWIVRAFYRTWAGLPYLNHAPVGNGVYAVSREGRSRFGEFPPLVADDLFVQSRFAESERVCVAGATFTVQTPRTLRDLLRVRTRAYQGNRELAAAGLGDDASPGRVRSLVAVARETGDLPGVAVYAAVSAVALLRARRARGRPAVWLRDESTR